MNKFLYILKFICLFSFILLNLDSKEVAAQMTIRVTAPNASCTTCDNDDREFRIKIEHVSGGGANAGGDNETGWDNCGGGRTTSYAVTHYCPGGVVRVTGQISEDNGALGIHSGSCSSSRPSNTHTLNGTSSITGSVSPTGSSSGTINYTVQTSGNYRENARLGNQNFTCATSWALPVNATGTYFDGNEHTTNCGDAWYVYELTDANRSNIEFEPTADGLNTSEIVEVKYANCTGCSLGGGTGGLFGNSYRITNPKPGFYYVRVRVNQTAVVGSNDRRFDLQVRKGGATSAPSNDDINCATVRTLAFCQNVTGSGNNIGSSIQVGLSGSTCQDEPRKDDDRTVWYKFVAPTEIGTNLRVRVDNAGSDNMTPDIRLYKLNDPAYSFGTCPGSTLPNWAKLSLVGSNSGTYLIDNDAEINITSCSGLYQAGATYYLQINDEGGGALGYNEGNFNYSITDNGFQAGPNDICSAYDLGSQVITLSGCTPKFARTDAGVQVGFLERNESFRINRESNRCAGTQSGEPNSPNKSTWYKFTTGANVGTNINVNVDAINDLDAYVSVHYTCSGCAFGNLTEIAECGGTLGCYSVTGGPDDASVNFAPYPNTTYYIQVDGYNPVLGVGGGNAGDYHLTVSMNNTTPNGNDNFCSAWTAGTSNSPGGSGAAHTENVSNNDILDLNETITIPVFNNKAASAEEQCALDEPNVDEGDETVWYKFTTSGTPGTAIEIDASASNGSDGLLCFAGAYATLKVYEPDNSPVLPANCTGWTTSTNWFNGITPTNGTYFGAALDLSGIGLGVIGDNSKFRIDCPKPNTTYYIQVEALGLTCDKADFTMTIKDNGLTAGPNYICIPYGETTAGLNGYLGTLSSSDNTPLVMNNQTNQCANTTSGEPDNTGITSLNRTVWYKFKTPPADYSDGTLYHLYDVIIERLSSTPGDVLGVPTTFPDAYLYKSTSATARACADNSTDYNNLSLVATDAGDIINGNARMEYLCLEPNSDYYIQVDVIGISDYVNFNVRVKKSAFRPADEACDALDLFPGSTIPKNKTYTKANSPLNAAPYFGLPHSNRCKSAIQGTEPNITVGAPGGGGIKLFSYWMVQIHYRCKSSGMD